MAQKLRFLGTVMLLSTVVTFHIQAQSMSKNEVHIAQTLDAFHKAASEADFDQYFSLFAENGIFLGTDATERWDVAAFKAFAKPYFDKGQGWTYTSTERHIYISDDGQTAWFDERLENASLGECRGSGVLILLEGSWKVSQYNLTVPVPNELVMDLVQKIKAHEGDS